MRSKFWACFKVVAFLKFKSVISIKGNTWTCLCLHHCTSGYHCPSLFAWKFSPRHPEGKAWLIAKEGRSSFRSVFYEPTQNCHPYKRSGSVAVECSNYDTGNCGKGTKGSLTCGQIGHMDTVDDPVIKDWRLDCAARNSSNASFCRRR